MRAIDSGPMIHVGITQILGSRKGRGGIVFGFRGLKNGKYIYATSQTKDVDGAVVNNGNKCLDLLSYGSTQLAIEFYLSLSWCCEVRNFEQAQENYWVNCGDEPWNARVK